MDGTVLASKIRTVYKLDPRLDYGLCVDGADGLCNLPRRDGNPRTDDSELRELCPCAVAWHPSDVGYSGFDADHQHLRDQAAAALGERGGCMPRFVLLHLAGPVGVSGTAELKRIRVDQFPEQRRIQ